ncbi:MAG: hypothetical protein JNL74_00075 [Fibrobacteres bacterium]|nr:hypothetical protein [Fibrobacterota bacterium]
MSNNAVIFDLLNDPTISFWFKDALQKALKRDPVDALLDAELLYRVIKSRSEEILEEHHS